jgi:hypothetical protein
MRRRAYVARGARNNQFAVQTAGGTGSGGSTISRKDRTATTSVNDAWPPVFFHRNPTLELALSRGKTLVALGKAGVEIERRLQRLSGRQRLPALSRRRSYEHGEDKG